MKKKYNDLNKFSSKSCQVSLFNILNISWGWNLFRPCSKACRLLAIQWGVVINQNQFLTETKLNRDLKTHMWQCQNRDRTETRS